MAAQPTVVLIHGLFGFRKLLWREYFGLARRLYQQMGLRVLIPSLPWAGSIEQCAHALARQLTDETGPLHLVAHSMGGIDARDWICRLHGAGQVASLTTLSTPHRGSTAADLVCRPAYSPLRLFPGVRSLTTAQMQQFNGRTPDHPNIIYRSYSAARPVDEHAWLVRRFGRHIQQHEGDNDSQVSVCSARWGEHLGTQPCDHFELIELNLWLNPFRGRAPFDPMPLYREIGDWIIRQGVERNTR